MQKLVLLGALVAQAAAFVPNPLLLLAGPRAGVNVALRPPMGPRLGGQRPALKMQEQPVDGGDGAKAKLAPFGTPPLKKEQAADGDDGAAAKLAAAKAAAQAAEQTLSLEEPAAEELGGDGAAAKLAAAKAAAKAAERSLILSFDDVEEPAAEKPAEVVRSKKDQAQDERMAKFEADLRKVTSRDTKDKTTSSTLDTRGARLAQGVSDEVKSPFGFDDSKLKVRSWPFPLPEDPSGAN